MDKGSHPSNHDDPHDGIDHGRDWKYVLFTSFLMDTGSGGYRDELRRAYHLHPYP